jgi:hypothetical protein
MLLKKGRTAPKASSGSPAAGKPHEQGLQSSRLAELAQVARPELAEQLSSHYADVCGEPGCASFIAGDNVAIISPSSCCQHHVGCTKPV